jgi:3-carboxy-cis,cis-muconate cycloisomerase
MAVSVFEDALLGPLFRDPVTSSAFEASRTVERFNRVETALADACAAEGLVSRESADAVTNVLRAFAPDPATLASGTARDGIPVPAYVAALKAAVPEAHRSAVHFGATSQDVMDTALALALVEVNASLHHRLRAAAEAVRKVIGTWGAAPIMGRTRMQAALPITFADRGAAWLAPLLDHDERLARLRGSVEALQLGGPVGNRAGWGRRGNGVARRMGKSLGLAAPAPWHTRRDALGEYAAFLSLVTAAGGKIGQDVALMAQQGIDEAALSGGGGSSAMEHKRNPVLAELLVTLARYNAAQLGGFHQALLHEQERSGIAWALEWTTLPPMCAAAGRSLDAVSALLSAIERIGKPA